MVDWRLRRLVSTFRGDGMAVEGMLMERGKSLLLFGNFEGAQALIVTLH